MIPNLTEHKISGPTEQVVIAVEGDLVRVQELWDVRSVNLPFCPVPRGAMFPTKVVQRVVPMSRSEAVKMGLIR